MDKKLLKQYAEMAVKIGINIQKGQTLIINSPVDGDFFARACAEVAFEAGAKDVVIHYKDEKLSRLRMEKATLETLCDVKPYRQNSYLEYIKSEGSAAVLSIYSSDPEIYKGLDMGKVDAANIAASKAMEEYREYSMADKIQWCVISIPTPAWAMKIFPQLNEEEAMEKLWETIFKVSRVDGDPVANWKNYTDAQMKRRNHLNELMLAEVHLKSKNGTDLHVGLADNCLWGGGRDFTVGGVEFIANMPTEEIFTAPHKDRVNGIVYGTKPYVYNGNLIDEFVVTFKDGKVIDYDAKQGRDLLGQLLSTDEGASHIGEVAFVPASSPINKENILFYNTLFDENAACHIAFGQGYPGTVKGGTAMSKAELAAVGVNDSVIHEDVMVGANDMDITGTTPTGEIVQIFKNGEWVF